MDNKTRTKQPQSPTLTLSERGGFLLSFRIIYQISDI